MRYQIIFYVDNKISNKTPYQYKSYEDALYHLTKVMKYKFNAEDDTYTKNYGLNTIKDSNGSVRYSAEIVAENGIKF